MKIPLDQVRNLLRHATAVIIRDGERPVMKPNTDYYREDDLFLTLKWTNRGGVPFELSFPCATNQQVEYDESYGELSLIDANGDEIAIGLLEVQRERFDTEALYTLPLDRLIHKDNIERFFPYDRLGYNYQLWLHKNREQLIKFGGERFKVPLKKDEKDEKEDAGIVARRIPA